MSEEMIVRNSAPTLAGLKTANLFNCSFDSEREMTASLRRWNEALSGNTNRIVLEPQGFLASANAILHYIYTNLHIELELTNIKTGLHTKNAVQFLMLLNHLGRSI